MKSMARAAVAVFMGVLPLLSGAVSPFISKVYDYKPAPGQFINTMPAWSDGQSYRDVLDAAQEQLAGSATPGMICLGAFGGYVVFGFDHPLVNVRGEYDLKIYGNAFISDKELNGGSCEPGVVWVSRDTNGNGLPDDVWYELAGSECDNEATVHNFTIVYHKPADNHTAVPSPDDRAITDMRYIRWTSDHPSRPEGYIQANSFHRQSYWPGWCGDETLEFSGTLLPDNAVDLSGTGKSWVTCAFGEGYVDNIPTADDHGLKLDWAVDGQGNHVWLPSVDFIKVQSGMLQNTGWLGETSTEVCGAEDLHPEAVAETSGCGSVFSDPTVPQAWMGRDGNLWLEADGNLPVNVYTVTGMRIFSGQTVGGVQSVPVGQHALYIVEIGNHRRKLSRRPY